jgi:hypothetical protein
VRAGELALIRDADGREVLSYRSFASVVGIVAALVAAIVILTGAAGTLFLIAEERRGAAVAVMILSVAFTIVIALLVPRTRATLSDTAKPVLTIVQRSRLRFPSARYAVLTPDGTAIGMLRRSALARLGRNRWMIAAPPGQRGVAYAVEESLGRALIRKVAGKFNRRYEANFLIVDHGMPAGQILRRPDENGVFDVLELHAGAALDRRVAVALATLIFGSEP